MNPALQPAAGNWTQVRQGDKEFVPTMGQRVLIRVGDRVAVARLRLQDEARIWQWSNRSHVPFEDVDAWAQIFL